MEGYGAKILGKHFGECTKVKNSVFKSSRREAVRAENNYLGVRWRRRNLATYFIIWV